MSFPILPSSELLEILGELSLNPSKDILEAPSSGECAVVLRRFCDSLVGLNRLQTGPHGRTCEPPEANIRLFHQMRYLLSQLGLNDFDLRDLEKPTPFRFRAQLSGLVNAARFREAVANQLRDLQSGCGHSVGMLAGVMQERQAEAAKLQLDVRQLGEGEFKENDRRISEQLSEVMRKTQQVLGYEQRFQVDKVALKERHELLKERTAAVLQSQRKVQDALQSLTKDQRAAFDFKREDVGVEMRRALATRISEELKASTKFIEANAQRIQVLLNCSSEQKRIQELQLELGQQAILLQQAQKELQLAQASKEDGSEEPQPEILDVPEMDRMEAKSPAEKLGEEVKTLQAEVDGANRECERLFAEETAQQRQHDQRAGFLIGQLKQLLSLLELQTAEGKALIEGLGQKKV